MLTLAPQGPGQPCEDPAPDGGGEREETSPVLGQDYSVVSESHEDSDHQGPQGMLLPLRPDLLDRPVDDIIQGDEAIAVRSAVGAVAQGEKEMRAVAAADLADSDDEELSSWGREVARGVRDRQGVQGEREVQVRAQGVQQEVGRGGMVRPVDSLVARPEKRLEGKQVLVERYSRLRITNPQVGFTAVSKILHLIFHQLSHYQVSQADLSSLMAGRKFLPIHGLPRSPPVGSTD